jgi:hypothetical protein
MPIKYTNRKGFTFYLCKGVTKTGKPRYYFAREPKGEPVEQIPAGFVISESVNGVVSLTKARPMLILPEEIAAVQAAVQRHRKAGNYRVNVRHDQIEIYERVGADPGDLIIELQRDGLFKSELDKQILDERIRAERERYSQFTPVLRLILTDAETRTFGAQRMCYLGSIDDWIDLGYSGTAAQLAQRLIPTWGSDAFFDLH